MYKMYTPIVAFITLDAHKIIHNMLLLRETCTRGHINFLINTTSWYNYPHFKVVRCYDFFLVHIAFSIQNKRTKHSYNVTQRILKT